MSKPNSGPSPPRDPASAAPLSRKHVVLAWLWVGLCTLGIFLTVPVARSVRNYVEERWGLSVFGFSVLAAVAIALAGLVYLLWFRWRVRDFPRYLWLVLVAATYVYFTLKLWKRPEEAIHFLEYGLLGFLLFRALRFRIPDHGVFLAAFLVGATVGIFDEVLQWIIPLRYWDFRDVGLNALSSGLSQVAIWKGIQPPLRKSGIGRRSFR
ncbi:MAG: VanZ family protein, partial [Candidatus Aminicenantales bacterium]